MGKLFSTFFITLILFPVAYAQARSDRERANLVGPVKTVVEKSYKYTGSYATGDTVTYDAKGNEIERIMISDYGELMGKQTRTFDTAGQLKETVFTDPKGAVQKRSIYHYLAGRLVTILTYDSNGTLRERTDRSFNAKGNMAEETYLDPVAPRAKTVFSYDINGNPIEMAYFLSDGRKASAPVGPCLGAHRVTYTYDAKGRPITRSVYETDGRVKKSWKYSYDERGNFTEQTINSGEFSSRYIYKYEFDPQGNWLKSTADQVENATAKLVLKMLEATEKPQLEKASPEAKQKFEDSLKRTTVTIREITYH